MYTGMMYFTPGTCSSSAFTKRKQRVRLILLASAGHYTWISHHLGSGVAHELDLQIVAPFHARQAFHRLSRVGQRVAPPSTLRRHHVPLQLIQRLFIVYSNINS